MKDGVKLLNFARGGLVDEDALLVALDDNKVESYVTDFPSLKVIQNDKVIAIPHLGASTEESEENLSLIHIYMSMSFDCNHFTLNNFIMIGFIDFKF